MTDPVFQDWEKVVFKKDSKEKTELNKKAQLKQQYNSHLRKVENDDYVPEKPKFELRQFLQRARQERHMSQKELASRISVQPNVVQQWESGKIPIPGVAISQINRALKVNMKKQEILN